MVSDELRNSEKGILGNSKTEYYMPWCMQRHILNLIKKRDGVTASKTCWPEGSEGLRNPDFPELRKSELDDELRKSELDLGANIPMVSSTGENASSAQTPEVAQGVQIPLEGSEKFEIPTEFNNDSDEGCSPEGSQATGDEAQQICRSCGHDSATQECCTFKAKRARLAGRVGERRQQEQRRAEEAASVRPRAIPNVSEATTPAQRIMARLKQRVAGGPNPT